MNMTFEELRKVGKSGKTVLVNPDLNYRKRTFLGFTKDGQRLITSQWDSDNKVDVWDEDQVSYWTIKPEPKKLYAYKKEFFAKGLACTEIRYFDNPDIENVIDAKRAAECDRVLN